MTSPAGTPGDRRLRVLFALPFLSRIGGTERVIVTLLKSLDRERIEPALVVLDASRNELADEVPADVPIIDLGVKRTRWAVRPLMAVLRDWCPDVLMSNLGHLNLMIAILRPLLPRDLAVIGRETMVVTSYHQQFRTGALRNIAYRWFYPRLDLVVCQSRDMRDDLAHRLGFPMDRLRLIANPVDADRLRQRAALATPAAEAALPPATGPGPVRLVAVGRLTEMKGFDLLIDAIARLPRQTAQVLILGNGPARDSLQARIEAAGVQDRVRLLGFQPNPPAFIARADGLVISSRYEGLPNAVLEAIALGRPVIATPFLGGVTDLADSAGGIRVAEAISAPALAAAIAAFAADPVRQVGDISAYRADRIAEQYKEVLIEAAARRISGTV